MADRFFIRAGNRWWCVAVAALLGLLLSRPAAATDRPPPLLPRLTALAPVEILAQGFRAPTGVAVAPDGRVFFTDAKEGSLFEVQPNGTPRPPRLLTNGLLHPRGVVWEGSDRLLLLAEHLKPSRRDRDEDDRPGRTPRGLLLRFDLTAGTLTILADGLKHPRGLLRAADGTVYLSAEGLRRPGEGDEEDENGENGEEDREDRRAAFPGTIFRWTPAPGLQVVASGFKRPDGLVLLADGSLLVAAERFHNGPQRLRGSVFTIDPQGVVSVLLPDRLKRPSGLAQDATGALFLSAERPGNGRGRFPGVILKFPEGKPPHDFATGLDRPRGVAFDKVGRLLVADAEAGLLLRFRAPPSPTLDPTPPVATNQDPFSLQGATEAGTQLLVLGGREPAGATPGPDGRFQVAVPLRPNEENPLQVFAIGAAGQGVASAPASLTLIHDTLPPPAPLVHPVLSPTDQPSQRLTGTAEAGARVKITGGAALAEQQLGPDQTAFAVAVPLRQETTNTLQVTATDAAGNESPPTTVIIVHQSLRPPTLANFSPTAGKVGIPVTLTGADFRSVTRVTLNGVLAPGFTVNGTTTISMAVPAGATTGPVAVTTLAGTATSRGHFIVLPTLDFTLVVAPTTVTAIPGPSVSLKVSTVTTGGYTGLMTLSTGTLPPGVTASFTPPFLGPNASGLLTLTTSGTTPSVSSIEVRGTATIEGTVTTRTATTTLNVQAAGQTVLAGQVLDENERPIPGVSIKLGGSTITTLGTTDAAGNFLVPLAGAGPTAFLIDGSTANTSTVSYPTIPVTVTIQAGVVNTLGYTPHLMAHPRGKTVPILASQETVLAPAEVPGLAVQIPAGITITGWDGQPNTEIGVVAVPVDRSGAPPIPAGQFSRTIYAYTFGKVGGGTPSQPVPITYPNDIDALPGEQVDLYFFDEAPDGSRPNAWAKYGTGTVSADGTTILPDTDPTTGKAYGVPRFCCGYNRPSRVPTSDRLRGPYGDQGGDPVELSTGAFVVTKTDLVLPGRLPLIVTRTYRAGVTSLGPFGIGTSWDADRFLVPPPNGSPDFLQLILAGGYYLPFSRQPDGTFQNRQDPAYRGAQVRLEPGLRVLRFNDGTTWRFRTLDGLLVSQTDRTGNTLGITRDSQGRVTALSEPAGRQLTVSYAGSSLRIDRITDPLGREVRYTYDAQGRLETVTDPAGGATRYTYDAQHRMLTITDPRGITFLTNEYDSANRVSRQAQADGGVWTFAYTTAGGGITATTVTDPRGHRTLSRFNADRYLVSRTDALGQTTTFDRQPGTNLLLGTTDPLGRVSRFSYDANGNVTSITDPLGNVRTFAYHPTFNKVTSITDPLGNLTTFEYDASGNLIAITDPLQNTRPPAERLKTTFTYNSFGQPLTTTDPLGNATTFTYDSTGNLAAITDPLGNTTQRTYDLVSRLIAQTDPLGKTTRFSYDALNRLVDLVDALNGGTAFGYDPNGNLLTVTDARGNTTTHTYDPMDRLQTRTDPLGGQESYQYDLNGNLAQFTDRKNQASTFTYDPLNRRTRATFGDASFTEFTYDGAGRLLTATDSLTGTVAKGYDALGRVLWETTPQGTIQYAYDALGRRTTMTVNGQAPVSYAYDAASRLNRIQQAPLSPVTIQYDAAGYRTLLTLPNGTSSAYDYEAAHRLVRLTYSGPSGFLGDLNYQHDPTGNRVAVTGSLARTLLPEQASSTTYDAANRQLTFGSKGMTYDANGNLTTMTDSSGTIFLNWDARNRLISIDGSTLSASFAYDALGRRVKKIINGERTDFQYDGGDVISETGGATGPVGYLNSLKPDTPFVRITGSGVDYYHADGLGSILALTDQDGVLRTQYLYEPFGSNQSLGGFSTNTFQYTARENDGTGFFFHRNRYYGPALHRFLSEDPIGLEGGLNLYAYVGNNPINRTDLWGLRPGDPYPTQNAAAVDAIKDINPTSISENREYAGWTYQKPDGNFSYTAPNRGTENMSTPGPTPSSGWPTGIYHTHGGQDPRYDSENFSAGDKNAGLTTGLDIYVGTPSGRIKKWTPETGQIDITPPERKR